MVHGLAIFHTIHSGKTLEQSIASIDQGSNLAREVLLDASEDMRRRKAGIGVWNSINGVVGSINTFSILKEHHSSSCTFYKSRPVACLQAPKSGKKMDAATRFSESAIRS